MKNLIKRIVAVLFVCIMVFSFACCNGGNSNNQFENQWDDSEQTESLKDDQVTGRTSSVPEEKPESVAGKYIVENNSSTYKIVIPEEGVVEQYAATELQYFIQQATSYVLPILSDEHSVAAPYISIGATVAAAESGVDTRKDELEMSGCSIVTSGDNIYIDGYDSTGILNGVYQFLHFCIDYEAYTPEEIYIKNTDSIPLYAFDYAYSPGLTIATSIPSMRTIQNAARMKMWSGIWGAKDIDGSVWAGGYFAHTILSLLPSNAEPGKSHTGDIDTEDGWYSNGQLCLTKESAISAMADVCASVLATSASDKIMIGGMDNGGSCGCKKCTEDALKYGGVGGVYIRFLNAVAEKVEDILGEDKEFYLYGFAYYGYSDPPVNIAADGTVTLADSSVKANEHVGMMVTTMGSCYYHPMGADDMCDLPHSSQTALKAGQPLQTICSGIHTERISITICCRSMISIPLPKILPT